MKLFFLGLTFFILIISCSHIGTHTALPEISFKVPEIEDVKNSGRVIAQLEELKALHADKPSQWWLTYRQAKWYEASNNSAEACKHYESLSKEPYFPLRDVAKIRKQRNCGSAAKGEVILAPKDQFAQKPWLIRAAQENYILQVSELPESEEKLKHYLDLVELPLKKDERIAHLQKLLELSQVYALSEEAPDYQERLYELAPRLRPNPEDSEQLFAAALDHRRAREFSQAEKIYRGLLDGKTKEVDEYYKAYNELRMTYKVQGNKDLYIKTTSDMAKWAERRYKKSSNSQNRRIYFDSHLNLTRAVWTEGQTSRAVQILRDLESTLKNKYPLAEVYWLQARIREERGRFDHALYWLKKAQDDRFGISLSLKSYVLWHQAWNLKKQGQTKDAIVLLEELVHTTKDPYDIHRYRYWLARSYEDAGRPEQAQKEFTELSLTDGLGYYGMLAYRSLGGAIPTLSTSRRLAREESQGSAYLSLHETTYLDWLISLKETEIALDYLEGLTAKLESERQSAEAWTEVLTYYARAGQYLPLFKQIGRVPSDLKDELLAKNPDYLFPQPYKEHSLAASEKTGVSPELIYSIMRQESAFDPTARSHADAFGLLQLLPRVAEAVAEKHGVPYSGYEDLYEPETNILLGGSLIKDLMSKYDNQFILAVASYNAAESAIQGWLNTRLRQDPTEFIEDIPYEETRNYVKLVLRNFILYSRISSEESEISFPEWCLQNLHRFKS